MPEWSGFSFQDRTDGVYVASSGSLAAAVQVGRTVCVTARRCVAISRHRGGHRASPFCLALACRRPGVSIGTGSQPAPAITTTSKWRVSSGRQVCVRFAARHLRQPALGLLENCRAAAIAAPRRGGSSPRRVHRNFQIASASSMASLSINRSSDVEGFQPAARAVLARRHLVPPGSRLRHRDSPGSSGASTCRTRPATSS